MWRCTLPPSGAVGPSPQGQWRQRGHCVGPLLRIGVLCAYAANQNLSSQVKNIRRYVNSNMRDLHTFANDTPMVSTQPLPHSDQLKIEKNVVTIL